MVLTDRLLSLPDAVASVAAAQEWATGPTSTRRRPRAGRLGVWQVTNGKVVPPAGAAA